MWQIPILYIFLSIYKTGICNFFSVCSVFSDFSCLGLVVFSKNVHCLVQYSKIVE